MPVRHDDLAVRCFSVDAPSTIPHRSFHPVRIRRWINILNVGASADPEQFIKNMLNNCTLSLFVIGGCDIYTYFLLLIFVTFIFQVIITEHNIIVKMYRVYLPICVHINVHIIPSILIFFFCNWITCYTIFVSHLEYLYYFVMFIVAEIVLQASDEARVIE